MNPSEVKKALDDIVAHPQEVWLAEDRKSRIKAAPIGTLSKEAFKKLLSLAMKLGIAPSAISVKTFYGIKVRAPIWSALAIKAKGFHGGEDLKLTKFIADTLKSGDTFIDGGANYGWYSLLANVLGAKVYAVEPTPSTFKILAKNAEGKNITVYPAALWNAPGEMQFNDLGKGHDAINTLIDPGRFQWKGRVTTYVVRTMTLDELPCADFIKLDCEGAEYEILKGAKEALAKKPILAIELIGVGYAGGTAEKIIKLLAQKGYRGYYIADDFNLKPLLEKKWGGQTVVNAVFIA